MKKIIPALLALTLILFSSFACSKTKAGGFYRERSSLRYAESASLFTPREGSFDQVLGLDLASVYKNEEGKKNFGMARISTGELLIPFRYLSLTASGDFILAETTLEEDALFVVYYKDGTKIYESDDPLTVQDVGDGIARITDNGYVLAFDKTGRDVLSSTSLGEDYELSSCENFILAKNGKTGTYLIFNAKTGEIVSSFFASESAEPFVCYAGGNDFIAIYNEKVSAGHPYKAAVQGEGETVFYDQKIYRVTIGVSSSRELAVDRFIYKLSNRYDFGLTSADREEYPLKGGYFAESDYKTENKIATGEIEYRITNASLSSLSLLPSGVSPTQSATDGYIAASNSSFLYLFDSDLKELLKKPNENFQSVKLSDEAIVLSKIENGKLTYGAIDLSGKEILPFSYSYLSEFRNGKAVGVKDKKAYLVSKDGSERYVSDETFPYYWDGFCIVTQGGRTGAIDYNGENLVPYAYDGIAAAVRFGDTVYLSMKIGEVIDLFILE